MRTSKFKLGARLTCADCEVMMKKHQEAFRIKNSEKPRTVCDLCRRSSA